MSFLITFTFFYVYVIFTLGGMFMETLIILCFLLPIIFIIALIILSIQIIKIKNKRKKQEQEYLKQKELTQQKILQELQKLNQNKNETPNT